MKCTTHLKIDTALCGTLTHLEAGRSHVTLTTTDRMGSDDRGLVHGGFLFGMADYAAMCAVNDPYVVLGAADTRFIKPVTVGETLTAEAVVEERNGKKNVVEVSVRREAEIVFTGRFTCFVLESHVLG